VRVGVILGVWDVVGVGDRGGVCDGVCAGVRGGVDDGEGVTLLVPLGVTPAGVGEGLELCV
jgi:hypothetical protein